MAGKEWGRVGIGKFRAPMQRAGFPQSTKKRACRTTPPHPRAQPFEQCHSCPVTGVEVVIF